MLKERRTKHVEYRPVKLDDVDAGSKLPDGSLIIPVGVSDGELTYGVPDTVTSDLPEISLAKVLFSEPEKFDTLEVDKTVALQGTIEIRTDQFIAADAVDMVFGKALTAVKDTDGVLKFGLVAAATDIVVGRVTVPPGDDPDGLLGVAGTFI